MPIKANYFYRILSYRVPLTNRESKQNPLEAYNFAPKEELLVKLLIVVPATLSPFHRELSCWQGLLQRAWSVYTIKLTTLLYLHQAPNLWLRQ